MSLNEQYGRALTYELVTSRRAKRASLRVVPGRGLVVTVPQRFPKNDVAAFVKNNRVWIDASLADLEARILPRFRQWPPRKLPLLAMQLRMVFTYEAETPQQVPAIESADLHCRIKSPMDDKPAVAHEIAQHLKELARRFLPPLLASYSHLHGFQYQRVSIRGQRSVWGSYSSSGTISLNYKLLFLSRELVDYVLLHELAHTVHLNHSAAFWELLCRVNVNARVLDRRLADAGHQVPPWLELAGGPRVIHQLA
ncbi:MAG: M48 family metallopeptidase [Granulosicoccus sp.]